MDELKEERGRVNGRREKVRGRVKGERRKG